MLNVRIEAYNCFSIGTNPGDLISLIKFQWKDRFLKTGFIFYREMDGNVNIDLPEVCHQNLIKDQINHIIKLLFFSVVQYQLN